MLEIEKVHHVGESKEGHKIITKTNAYRMFIAKDQPDVFLQGGVFYYADGRPLEDQVNLPDYVKNVLPKDFFEKKEQENNTLSGLPTSQLEKELAARRKARLAERLCEHCGKEFKNVGAHKRKAHVKEWENERVLKQIDREEAAQEA